MPEFAAAAQLHGYILAGGRSFRMGTDKALLAFGTSTLLGRAIATLSAVCADITLLGPSRPGQPALRALSDRVPTAGPVAGVEAALFDLSSRSGEWALFLPLDVPLLPPGLLRALTGHWLTTPATRIAFPIVDGRAQPVISLVHVSALPSIHHSLETEQRRLRVAYEIAAAELSTRLDRPLPQVLSTPAIALREDTVYAERHPLPWHPSPEELCIRDLWFANANTPAELDILRRAVSATDRHRDL